MVVSWYWWFLAGVTFGGFWLVVRVVVICGVVWLMSYSLDFDLNRTLSIYLGLLVGFDILEYYNG